MADVNIVNFKIGGPAGSGVATVGLLFSKCLQRAGLSVFGTNDYPSLIKGGHNTYAVSASNRPISSLVGKTDILVALDKATVELHAEEMSPNGAVIYDSVKVANAEEIAKRKDILFVGAPFSEMASKAGGEIMLNTVMAGAAFGILDVDFNMVESLMRHVWKRKGQAVVDANTAAAKAGYEFSKGKVNGSFKAKIQFIKRDKTIFINGNEACVAGALRAGCKFVAEYPMSPSSSILHLMAGHEMDYGVIVKQTEDEIAAMNMIAGAAFAGARAMTATSGGGFSLMAEGFGLAGIAEVPCVIFESQRAGPSTGLPTYTEQADLRFVLHASQGEFPRVVVAPGDAEECFIESFNAFNIAEKVQTPVVVLIDKYLSESSVTCEDPRRFQLVVDRGKLQTDSQMETAQDFKRYLLSKDGMSPRCIPGQKNGMHVCSSYEHDETGFTSEDPQMRVSQIGKREKKLDAIPESIIAPSFHGASESEAEILIVCWGSTKGPALEALMMLGAKGAKARIMHIRYASPLPVGAILAALQSAKNTIIIEGNSEAQMRSLILQKTGYHIEKTYLRYDGRPFTPKEIAGHVIKLLGK